MSATRAIKIEQQPAMLANKPILFGTDFSPSSEGALKWLKVLALQVGSKVLLTYFDRTDADDPDAGITKPADINSRLTWITEDLKRAGADAESVGIAALRREKPFVLRALEARLKEIADASQNSLIVLGTHGYTGLKRFLFGSFSEMVFRHSDSPVLIVGPVAAESAVPENISKVLFVTDFQVESVAAFPTAVHFARELGAELTLAHVNRTPSILQMRESETEQRLLKLAYSQNVEDAEVVELFGNPCREIVQYAKQNGIGTIVLGIRTEIAEDPLGLRFPGSLASSIIAKAPCPVLTYRGKYQGHATFFRASSGF